MNRKLEQESEEFRKYREQMHGTEEESRPALGGQNKAMRTVFAIIMIIVYIGVGILLLINFFNWSDSINWIRYIIGIVLIIYGAFRAYRYVAGIDY